MTQSLRNVGVSEALRVGRPFVGAQWVHSGPKREVAAPFDETLRAEVVDAYEAAVDAALDSAERGARHMQGVALHERISIIERMAAGVNKARDRLAATMTWQTGKPIRETRREAERAVDTLLLTARSADALAGRQVLTDLTPAGAPLWAYTHRRPLGVVAAITPYNAPLNLLAHKLGPALLAGNSVVIKPAPATSVVTGQLVEIALEAGVPEEALQLLPGEAEPAIRIARDPRVRGVTFTGGPIAARAIWRASVAKHVIMELGGNSANLVFDDAEIGTAGRELARGAYSNSGQSCNSVQRIICHQDRADELIEVICGQTEQLVIGDPFDPTTDIGSMASKEAAERVEASVKEAVEGGAKLLLGGSRRGATVMPTFLDAVCPDMRVAKDEIFGPVAVLLRARNDDHAIELANATSSGLQFSVFTNRIDRALASTDRLECGSLLFNRSSNYRLDAFVYGGVKESGVGREEPRSTILSLSEPRFVVLGSQHE
jgi:acyl-CoA reductase-like NAD-dependent aldehyde dehydrogenase